MKNIALFLYSFLLICPVLLNAQFTERGTPRSFSAAADISAVIARLEMPAINVASLLLEDEDALASNLPMRFAHGFPVRYNLRNSGTWETLPSGGRIWRLQIWCPAALNINFLYDDFYLPEGSEFYIYNEDQSQILGAYTAANNRSNRKFATPLVSGETATLEYYEPASVSGQGRIQIAQVAHGYRNLDGSLTDTRAGACQVNVNCPEGNDWQDEKKGVARIIMDGLYLCSGSLVNNTANDCTPYFLTANHCIDGGIKQDALFNPDLSGYVFYWNYEYANCAGAGNLPEQTTQGGTVLANTNVTGQHTILGSDFALIRLAENPRDRYDVYFNGWDATGEPGETGVGIHHPAGDDKKISTHSQVPVDNGYFWDLYWDPTPNGYAVTEGGSSGSPLFRENGLIIGQLFGGSSVNCDEPENDLAKYGKVSYSWENAEAPLTLFPEKRRLLDWLDPLGEGTIRSMAGAYDPCNTPLAFYKNEKITLSEADAAIPAEDGCRFYQEIIVPLGISPFPSAPVQVMARFLNDVPTGLVLNDPTVSFSSVVNEGAITLHLFDDNDVQGDRTVELELVVNTGPASVLNSRKVITLEILDDEQTPQAMNAHIQAVTNGDSPAEAYLGPGQTVYFFDPGSSGIMARVHNPGTHDFGCSQFWIDRAGATADNSWSNGSVIQKTFRMLTANPQANEIVEVSLYFTASELEGWERYNSNQANADQLKMVVSPQELRAVSEGMASSLNSQLSNYRDGTILTAAVPGDQSGFGAGVLSEAGTQQLNIPGYTIRDLSPNGSLTPNPANNLVHFKMELTTDFKGQILIRDMLGRIQSRFPVQTTEMISEELNITNLMTGIYVLQVVDESGKQLWSGKLSTY